MSGPSGGTGEAARPAGAETGNAFQGLGFSDLLWAGFAVAMLVVMSRSHAAMTVPYHFIFVSFALVYGFRVWAAPVALTMLVLMTLSTGAVFLIAYRAGEIKADELAEIPLMPAIVAFMVWHALRGAAARREVEQLALREAGRVDRQRGFLRDTSHAIRTPVTIARGHVQLMRMSVHDPELVQDTGEVLHQLDRIHQLAGRLLAIEQLETTPVLDVEPIDLQHLVETVGRRWSAAAPRQWRVDARPAGLVTADEHRLTEALDALVENALRFTTDADTVRLSAYSDGTWAVAEVADSGPGIPVADQQRVFDRFFQRHPKGEEPGTGLGLALVAAVATAHGGEAAAGSAVEGGALLRVRLPMTARSASADDEASACPRATAEPPAVRPDRQLTGS
jgi:signal transduction histidine kinase